MKIVATVLFAFHVLNVASLADAVFTTKGFIVDATDFYQKMTAPILRLLESCCAWLQSTRALLDLVVSVSLANLASNLAVRYELAREGMEIPAWAFLLISVLWLPCWLAIAIGLYMLDPRAGLILTSVSMPFWWLARGWIMGKIFQRKPTYVERVDYRTALYILSVYLIVAVVAAISAGLSRPLSD